MSNHQCPFQRGEFHSHSYPLSQSSPLSLDPHSTCTQRAPKGSRGGCFWSYQEPMSVGCSVTIHWTLLSMLCQKPTTCCSTASRPTNRLRPKSRMKEHMKIAKAAVTAKMNQSSVPLGSWPPCNSPAFNNSGCSSQICHLLAFEIPMPTRIDLASPPMLCGSLAGELNEL